MRKKAPVPQKAARTKTSEKKLSAAVTKTSDAANVDETIFTWSDPKKIARSLKEAVEESKEREGTPLQSALSMLNYYIDRAGDTLSDRQRIILEKAKGELRHAFGSMKHIH